MSSNRLIQLMNFLKDSPKDSFIRFAMAKEYEKLEQWEKALDFYLSLVKDDPQYIGTYYHLGKLYERQEQFEKAFATYQNGMAMAKKLGDQHAFSELAGAKLALDGDW